MSKSVKRVRAALEAAGLEATIRETGESARTAELAAAALGVEVDQIAKSILFAGARSERLWLFLTAGGNRVDGPRAEVLAGEKLAKADAGAVRAVTGFVIGGVAPLGHLTPPAGVFLDPRLFDFAVIWAAAGTPHHVFSISPGDLERVSGARRADFVDGGRP